MPSCSVRVPSLQSDMNEGSELIKFLHGVEEESDEAEESTNCFGLQVSDNPTCLTLQFCVIGKLAGFFRRSDVK